MVMASDYGAATSKMSKLLDKLISVKQLAPGQCDTVLAQYKSFLRFVRSDANADVKFSSYDMKTDSLDTFLADFMSSSDYSDLWESVKPS